MTLKHNLKELRYACGNFDINRDQLDKYIHRLIEELQQLRASIKESCSGLDNIQTRLIDEILGDSKQ